MRMARWRRMLVLALMVCLGAGVMTDSVFSRQKSPVSGTVADTAGSPVRAVVVKVVPLELGKAAASDDVACEVLTSRTGQFECDGMRDMDNRRVKFASGREYQLSCSLPGYKDAKQRFKYTHALKGIDVKLVRAIEDGDSSVHPIVDGDVAPGDQPTNTGSGG